MTEIKETQIDDLYIARCRSNMKTLVSMEKKEDIEKSSIELFEAKDYLLNSKIEENVVRNAIISYILSNYEAKDIKSKEIINNFINYFDQKQVIELSLELINNIFKKSPPFNVMIEFQENISKDKQYLEVFFKIMIISKNIKDIIKGIKFLFNIEIPNIENQLNKLSFDNPYSILLLRDLINKLIINKNKIEEKIILNNVITNLKKYYPFYCPKCLGILYISFFDGCEIFCYKEKFHSVPEDIN